MHDYIGEPPTTQEAFNAGALAGIALTVIVLALAYATIHYYIAPLCIIK